MIEWVVTSLKDSHSSMTGLYLKVRLETSLK